MTTTQSKQYFVSLWGATELVALEKDADAVELTAAAVAGNYSLSSNSVFESSKQFRQSFKSPKRL